MAAAAQRIQHGPFGRNSGKGCRTGDRGQQLKRRRIRHPRLYADCALTGCREELRHRLRTTHVAATEPVEACRRQQCGLNLPRRDLAKPGIDIAP